MNGLQNQNLVCASCRCRKMVLDIRHTSVILWLGFEFSSSCAKWKDHGFENRSNTNCCMDKLCMNRRYDHAVTNGFIHISLPLANTLSSIKHFRAATEENCRGFHNHSFFSVFPVSLQLPPEVADSLSLCLKVKAHRWRQAKLPDTLAFPWANVIHRAWPQEY